MNCVFSKHGFGGLGMLVVHSIVVNNKIIFILIIDFLSIKSRIGLFLNDFFIIQDYQ